MLPGCWVNVTIGILTQIMDTYHVISHNRQQTMIKGMLERHELENCTTGQSPYQSGISIDRINHNGIDPNSSKY